MFSQHKIEDLYPRHIVNIIGSANHFCGDRQYHLTSNDGAPFKGAYKMINDRVHGVNYTCAIQTVWALLRGSFDFSYQCL